MITYKDIDHDSNIAAYKYGGDYIIVQFKHGGKYEYTYQSAGSYHIEQMKQLADLGDGLNAYINKHVRKNYSKKF